MVRVILSLCVLACVSEARRVQNERFQETIDASRTDNEIRQKANPLSEQLFAVNPASASVGVNPSLRAPAIAPQNTEQVRGPISATMHMNPSVNPSAFQAKSVASAEKTGTQEEAATSLFSTLKEHMYSMIAGSSVLVALLAFLGINKYKSSRSTNGAKSGYSFPHVAPRASLATMSEPISAPQAPEPPFPTVITYNQSKHATNSVISDIRSVWGSSVRIIQTIEDGVQRLPNVDGCLIIGQKKWGDLAHFEERLNAFCAKDNKFASDKAAKKVCFMPGWSAFAESSESARAVTELGLVWPGTEPVASEILEKIGFKRICEKVGAPTPPFVVLSEEGLGVDLTDEVAKEETVQTFMKLVKDSGKTEKGLIKSIHGGGGKGTASLEDPSDPEQVRAAVEKVLNEMNRTDGIYFEQKVNQKGDGRFYQIELEVDGDVVADGGRFVWFNSRFQKVVEIGLSDTDIGLFIPKDLYEKSRDWARDIARESNNNTRATMEGLVFSDGAGNFEMQFIECNRRPQVENEALALLQQDSSGYRRYTFAELMMRAAGYKAPTFGKMPGINVVLHARWLHGNPDSNGDITYQPGNVLGMTGPNLHYVASELLSPGEISFTADPQLGKSVIVADSWEQMCERATEYFTLRRPNVLGSSATYAQIMCNLFSNPKFRKGEVASNETFKYLDIPEFADRTITNIVEDQVAPVLVNGYRPGEGIDPDRFPTKKIVDSVTEIAESLMTAVPAATKYTAFAKGTGTYQEYIKDLKAQLDSQGGGWVTVAPRDTVQQGNDSESCSISMLSRLNAEVWAQKAGCVGYEIGGAQFQAGLIRGFNPATIMQLGLPYNMPAHSLQRSQYVNGLAELPATIRQPLFDATAKLISETYRPGEAVGDKWVPWQPYNFHAGNYYDPARNYSPQDETTGELLKAKCIPIPCWVFSPKFPMDALKAWAARQVDIYKEAGLTLETVRIKNPGQGVDWTTEAVWDHVATILAVFKEKGLDAPVVYIHNHDFNGMASHIGAALLRKAQENGFRYLVVDAAYRKNGTHNDNTVVTDALTLTDAQKDALAEWGHIQQQIEMVLTRFDSRVSQMTPWDSDWAGGTEGSDLRIAKEYDINPRLLNPAKEVATEVFPLERAVTPFSEYKLRLGIGILLEEGIQPKTAEKVREWVNKGGKLRVGGDVLVGLQRWETLVPKSPEVDQLLKNMDDELQTALNCVTNQITMGDLPADATPEVIFNSLGFQQKGFDFAKAVKTGSDLTPLLMAPLVLHSQPRTLPAGTKFEVFDKPGDLFSKQQVTFTGFGKLPNGDISMGFLVQGNEIKTSLPDPDAAVAAQAADGPRKAVPGDITQMPCLVPGEVLQYNLRPGDSVKAGDPMVVLESMKMEMKISVPDEYDGMIVKAIPCKVRTKETQGAILSPGDLLLEFENPDECAFEPEETA